MVYVAKQFHASVTVNEGLTDVERARVLESLHIAEMPQPLPVDDVPVCEVARSVRHKGSVYKEETRGWKSRFLALEDGGLTVSLVEAYVGETRTLPLSAITDVLHVNPADKAGKDHVFAVLATNTAALFFQADSEDACNMWVAKLQAAIGLGG
jgi:hypothetical protein